MNGSPRSQKEKEDHICPIGKEHHCIYMSGKDDSKKKHNELFNREIERALFAGN